MRSFTGPVSFPENRRVQTRGDDEPRTPVFVGMRSDGGIYVAENLSGGYTMWREGEPDHFGRSTQGSISTCGSGSDSDFVACLQSGTYLSADDLRLATSQYANYTRNMMETGVATNYRDATGRLMWLFASNAGFRRQQHDGGTLANSNPFGVSIAPSDSATDSNEAVWISGAGMSGIPTVIRLDRTSNIPTIEALSGAPTSGQVQVAAGGNRVVVAWVQSASSLHLAMRGGWAGRFTYNLGVSGWSIVDTATSGDSVVVLLSSPSGSQVLIHRADGFVVFAPTFPARAVHLGAVLSIAGDCVTNCTMPLMNPVDQWLTRPDGGAW